MYCTVLVTQHLRALYLEDHFFSIKTHSYPVLEYQGICVCSLVKTKLANRWREGSLYNDRYSDSAAYHCTDSDRGCHCAATAQHSTIQYSTVCSSTVQHSTAQDSIVQ